MLESGGKCNGEDRRGDNGTPEPSCYCLWFWSCSSCSLRFCYSCSCCSCFSMPLLSWLTPKSLWREATCTWLQWGGSGTVELLSHPATVCGLGCASPVLCALLLLLLLLLVLPWLTPKFLWREATCTCTWNDIGFQETAMTSEKACQERNGEKGVSSLWLQSCRQDWPSRFRNVRSKPDQKKVTAPDKDAKSKKCRGQRLPRDHAVDGRGQGPFLSALPCLYRFFPLSKLPSPGLPGLRMCALCHPVVPLYWISLNILQYWDLPQCAQLLGIGKSNILQKGPCETGVPMVFWRFLVDSSRHLWLHAVELCPWGCLTLDGHAWLNTRTQ